MECSKIQNQLDIIIDFCKSCCNVCDDCLVAELKRDLYREIEQEKLVLILDKQSN